MILVAPDGTHPLAQRAADENRLAIASYVVAQALEGLMPWDAAWRCLDDRQSLRVSEEVVLLQYVVDAAHNPVRIQRGLLRYVRYLSRSEGLNRCATYFAELARTLAGENEAPTDLMIELAMLYLKETRFIEAKDVWAELELRGDKNGDAWLTLRARIGKGRVAFKLGNLGDAENIFLLASAEARDFTDLRAMARGNLGTVYDHMHPPRYEDAALMYWDAFSLFTDPMDRWQALMNVGTAAVGCKNYAFADVCFRIVTANSECWQDITNCLIERLDVCSAIKAWDEVAKVEEALTFRLSRFTPDMAIDHLYRKGLIELRSGRNPAPLWEEARQMAADHRLWEWEARMRRVLEQPPTPPEPVRSPRLERAYVDCALQCMTAGL